MSDYIYSRNDLDLFEDVFIRRQGKWARSIAKRGRTLAEWLSPIHGRLRERIVEYPLTMAALAALPRPARVADVGGASSLLGLELVYLGLEVHVLDLRPYPLKHPALVSTQIDLFDNRLGDACFDAMSCISVIEHVGLERYGGKSRADGDMAFMAELVRLCRPGGKIVLSGPYCRGHEPADTGRPLGYRVYDRQRLARLLSGLAPRQLRFFAMREGVWLEVSQDEADKVETARPVNGIFWTELTR